MLTEEARGRIEKVLLRERERVLEAIGKFEENNENLQDRAGELSVYRFHMADIGTEAHEQEKDFALASMEGRRLYALDDALRRLYKTPEAFGICERCGKDIEEARLEVVPEAQLCGQCQNLVEEASDQPG
ncbi:TraR/DksA family transcriptional regulator [soil metagenome]|jgi:RNA polymerase-binding transcription factor DksA|nr:TraR/DksA C4-type zinc finger protein [Gemmatimonadota bacterium]